jgi:RNA polymerase sigma-70 factor (ECF subfamily)
MRKNEETKQHQGRPTKQGSCMVKEDATVPALFGGELAEDFRSLYARYAKPVCFYLQRMTGCPHMAEDLTQEAFLKALRNLDGFRGESSFKTWIFAIATNCCRDHMKKANPARPTGEEIAEVPCFRPTPLEMAQRRQEVRRLRQAILALPEELRAPLLLVRFEEMKYREAAAALGLTLETVRMRVHRAHLALARALRTEGQR